jgi:predicted outer membrane protein
MVVDRRLIVSGLTLVAAAPRALGQSPAPAGGKLIPVAGAAENAQIRNAARFFATVIPRAELSLATSQIAVENASNANAKEFAGFELGEAITVNMVLKDMLSADSLIAPPPMELVNKLKALSKGVAFDRTYIAFQLENHIALRDMADAFLSATVGSREPAEKHGRHLATLMLAVFKEHVAICKRISSELKA